MDNLYKKEVINIVEVMRKMKASVDKHRGKYRVQLVEISKYENGRIVENFMGSRHFNMRKDADAFAKNKRTNYKKV